MLQTQMVCSKHLLEVLLFLQPAGQPGAHLEPWGIHEMPVHSALWPCCLWCRHCGGVVRGCVYGAGVSKGDGQARLDVVSPLVC